MVYHPTAKVLAVLELLQTHKHLSGQELAHRLEVDVRTIRRYITSAAISPRCRISEFLSSRRSGGMAVMVCDPASASRRSCSAMMKCWC